MVELRPSALLVGLVVSVPGLVEIVEGGCVLSNGWGIFFG